MQSKSNIFSSTQQQANAPVEIDAQLLHLVSGGAPKAGWNEPEAEVQNAQLVESSTSAPKAGW